MFGIQGPLGTVLDLLVVILGFGLIVFFHECGHFFAARWAGIRVLAFAIGFGPAALSYRKGLGWRRGSTEPEYERLIRQAQSASDEERQLARQKLAAGISPTEYRLNLLPLGGYVRMLGQEDLHPEAVSDAPDSYQNCKPWKRMIVISAGVVANIVIAAILFVIVFMVGLKVEPPVIGSVEPGSPAASAVAIDADETGPAGLKPGDRVIEINGRSPNTFADLRVAVAMTARDAPVRLTVEREGRPEPLHFEIKPEVSSLDGLLTIGIQPALSLTVADFKGPDAEQALASIGLKGVKPGMQVTAVNGDESVRTMADLVERFAHSGGEPVDLTFTGPDSKVTCRVEPLPEFDIGLVPGPTPDTLAIIEHVLGLVPVLCVDSGENALTERGVRSGLKPADIFARIGSVEFPGVVAGIREIRAHAGKDLDLTVLRQVDGRLQRVDLKAPVSRKGMLGFFPSDTRARNAMVAMPPESLKPGPDLPAVTPPASTIIQGPGQRLIAIDGKPVETLIDVRNALLDATADELAAGQPADIAVTLEWPSAQTPRPRVERIWHLSADDVAELHTLSWRPPFSEALFEPAQVLLKSSNPSEALATGLSETRRVLIMTYVTFARLFQQTVKIEHLKGPVGIAHIGTLLADRGFVWVLFFMAVISVNLAVINFLPLPIVDGGQFLMIVYEQIRGRPVPVPVQNAVTMAGLILIASLFLIVTFNDVKNLLGL